MSSNASNSRRQNQRNDNKRIASLVAKEMAKVIPQIVSQVHALNSQTSVDSKPDASKSTFSYKQFKACEPMAFTGEKGVSQLLHWFKFIEVTFR